MNKRLLSLLLINLIICLPISFSITQVDSENTYYEYHPSKQIVWLKDSNGDILVEYSYDDILDQLKKTVYEGGEIKTINYYSGNHLIKVIELSVEPIKEAITKIINNDTDYSLSNPVDESVVVPVKEALEKLSIKAKAKIDNTLKKELDDYPNKVRVLLKKKDTNKLFQTYGVSSSDIIKNKIQGKIKREVKDYIAVEVSTDELAELLAEDSVEKAYVDQEYSVLLDNSVPSIGAGDAWELGIDGSGVKVAVLDTGVDVSHAAFGNRVIQSEAFTGELHVTDSIGHGTHVAGIVAADGDYKGVAPGALILNAKVLSDDGKGYTSYIIAGIEWAIENGANVIVMSLGKPGGALDVPLTDAIQDAIDNGLIVVVASGNCGSCGSCDGYEGVTSPGHYKDAITVGAVDDFNNVGCFSSGQDYGSYIKPDIVAPGVGIISTKVGGVYGSKSGTSMAAPHIAGVAALMLQDDPSLTNYQIKDILENNAIDLGDEGKDVRYGSGVVELSNIFDSVVNDENLTLLNDTTLILGSIGGARFVQAKQLDTLYGEDITSNQVVYLKNETVSIVEEIKFDDYKGLREFMYQNFHFVNDSDLEFVDIDGKFVIDDGDKLIWFNDLFLYTLNTNNGVNDEIVNDYLNIISSDVKSDLGQTKSFLKLQESKLSNSYVTTIYNSTGEHEVSEILENPIETIIFTNETGTYTIQASCSDYGAYSCSSEGTWGTSNEGYYLYQCKDFIVFGVLLCWDLVSTEGDGSHCSLLEDHTTKRCAHHWGDCDADSECVSGYECVDGDWFANDGCCTSSEGYDGSYCYAICSEGWLNDYQCGSGEWRQRKWQNTDCSTEWKNYKDCDDYDSESDWTYYCPDSSYVKRSKDIVDGYCSSNNCYTSSSQEIETVSQNGDDNFCDDRVKYDCSGCAQGKYDCDSDDECSGSLKCVDQDSNSCGLWEDCGCCDAGDWWLDSHECFTPCDEGHLNEYKCENDKRYRKYREEDCTTWWDEVEDCNDQDDPGNWDYYCPDADTINKRKTVTDGHCSGTSCTTTETDYDEVAYINGHGDFCTKRKDYGCSLCTYGRYDCDYDSECSASAPDCVDSSGGVCLWGAECGCCDWNEKWDETNNRCKSCTDSDDDGYYAEDYCSGDQDCNDNDDSIYPGATETCNGKDDDCDVYIDEGDVCDCDISSVIWDETNVQEGDSAGLTVNGDSNCNGKTVSFKVYEDDLAGDDEANNHPSSATFSYGQATSTWTAEWQSDISGDPEYYFIATVNGEDSMQSGLMEVSQACTDDDSDTFYSEDSCPGEKDCNDNDNSIFPGATEICNGKDDDCDGTPDEDSNMCGDYDKCVSGVCEWKTCSELNYNGQCFDATDSDCIDDDVYSCDDIRPGIPIQLCYVLFQDCAEDQFCEEGWPAANCIDNYCSLTSASWSHIEVNEGQDVLITVRGDNCADGETADIRVLEVDTADFDDEVDNIGPKSFSNSKIEFTWKAKYVPDYMIPLDTYRIEATNENTEVYEGNLIIHDCLDADDDDYFITGNCGTLVDCDDNDDLIYPGAYERCNGDDDDCDGLVDEDFDMLTDENNCGSCGNVCGENEVCEGGECAVFGDCGDGICANNEICAKDCLKVESFYNLPETLEEGISTTLSVVVSNIGNVAQIGTVEVGIIPTDFGNQEFGIEEYMPVDGCCPQNFYYATNTIQREAGESLHTPFVLSAPAKNAVDECDAEPKQSAWGDSFQVVAGAYDKCSKDGGEGYYSSIRSPITINPLCAANQCTHYGYRLCSEVNTFCCDYTVGGETVYRSHFYCNDDLEYDVCTNSDHTPCMQRNTAYCTLENDEWMFRECPYGCESGACSDPNCDKDGRCDAGENSATCSDCGCDYDGLCEPIRGEDEYNCEFDCTCDNPDGSSAQCDCDSDNDCDPGTVCVFGSGWDACEPYSLPHECSVVDQYECSWGNVYRCENVAGRRKLVLVDVCSYGEICPVNVNTLKQCENINNYGLIIEYASSGTIVNKQPGDLLLVKVKSDFDMIEDLEYDSSAFSLLPSCNPTDIKAGVNACLFKIDSNANGDHDFRIADASESVKVIDGAYSLYLTNVEQLFKRYSDNNGVEVLLAKAYEKASKYHGVVYDLSLELNENHPFDYSFSSYNQPLNAKENFNNEYIEAVSELVDSKCNGCRQTVIVGDDYVVPLFRGDIPLGYAYADNTFYSDSVLNLQEPSFYAGDLQDVFNEWDDKYYTRKTKLIVPDYLTINMSLAINRLKATLINQFGNEIEQIRSSDIDCEDLDHFDEMKGSPIVIIGGYDNNNAAKCLSLSNNLKSDANTMFVSRSVWDHDEYALVIATDNMDVLDIFSMVIEQQPYELVSEPGMGIVDIGALIAGGVLIVAGIITSETGVGSTLIYAGLTLDAAVIGNDCYIENVGGNNWDDCIISVVGTVTAVVGGHVIGKIIKAYGDDAARLITKNLKKAAKSADPNALAKVINEVDDVALASKRLSDGIDFVTKNEPLEQVLKKMPKDIDEATKLRTIRRIGQVAEEGTPEAVESAENAAKCIDVPKLNKVMEDITSGDVGKRISSANQLKRGRNLKDLGHDIEFEWKNPYNSKIPDIYDKTANTAIELKSKTVEVTDWSQIRSSLFEASEQVDQLKVNGFGAEVRVDVSKISMTRQELYTALNKYIAENPYASRFTRIVIDLPDGASPIIKRLP